MKTTWNAYTERKQWRAEEKKKGKKELKKNKAKRKNEIIKKDRMEDQYFWWGCKPENFLLRVRTLKIDKWTEPAV